VELRAQTNQQSRKQIVFGIWRTGMNFSYSSYLKQQWAKERGKKREKNEMFGVWMFGKGSSKYQAGTSRIPDENE
jgi:hypothetical protein